MSADSSSSISRRHLIQRVSAAAAAWQASGSIATGEGGAVSSPHPFLTEAEDFYDVSRGRPKPHTLAGKALAEACLTPETWRLEIKVDPFTQPPDIKEAAEIEKPVNLDLPQLIQIGKRKGVKFVKAMQCLNITEPLGQGLWEGVPLAEVLRLCGRMKNVRRIYYRGFHNDDPAQIFQSSVSYTQAMDTPPGDLPVFLAYRLNGEAIPPVRGGPVRMLVPWAHGFKSIKWLREIFLTNDYRTNDTYALRNNDPESFLKTAAYVDDGSDEVPTGDPLVVTGQVINGLSGFKRVEYWVRAIKPGSRRLQDGDPEVLNAPWVAAGLLPPPNWDSVLPDGLRSKELLGFDASTGEPRSWPPRYGMAPWMVTLRDLKPGQHEIRVRAVDGNGYAQPEPRNQQKSGKNAIQMRRVTVV
jgi:DMSO/TMAO reductase YedYZ molybdopterin-dependent catalytic subunit